jgi:hypothetical protein
VYFEGDDAYLVTVLDKALGDDFLNKSLAIYKLTPDFLGVEEKLFEGFARDEIGIGSEAAHIIKRNGRYIMFSSRLVGWNSSRTMYTTATSLRGPWTPLQDLKTVPESTDSYNTQHDFVIPIQGIEATTYLYVGDRYSQHHGKGVGHNIFLPLVWDGDEPELQWYKQWRIDVGSGRWQAAVERP